MGFIPPTNCPCCECNGKLCMLYHVGHSCRIERMDQELIAAIYNTPPPEEDKKDN